MALAPPERRMDGWRASPHDEGLDMEDIRGQTAALRGLLGLPKSPNAKWNEPWPEDRAPRYRYEAPPPPPPFLDASGAPVRSGTAGSFATPPRGGGAAPYNDRRRDAEGGPTGHGERPGDHNAIAPGGGGRGGEGSNGRPGPNRGCSHAGRPLGDDGDGGGYDYVEGTRPAVRLHEGAAAGEEGAAQPEGGGSPRVGGGRRRSATLSDLRNAERQESEGPAPARVASTGGKMLPSRRSRKQSRQGEGWGTSDPSRSDLLAQSSEPPTPLDTSFAGGTRPPFSATFASFDTAADTPTARGGSRDTNSPPSRPDAGASARPGASDPRGPEGRQHHDRHDANGAPHPDTVVCALITVLVDLGPGAYGAYLVDGDDGRRGTALREFGDVVVGEFIAKVNVPRRLRGARPQCVRVVPEGDEQVWVEIACPCRGRAGADALADWLDDELRTANYPPHGTLALPEASQCFRSLTDIPADCHVIVGRSGVGTTRGGHHGSANSHPPARGPSTVAGAAHSAMTTGVADGYEARGHAPGYPSRRGGDGAATGGPGPFQTRHGSRGRDGGEGRDHHNGYDMYPAAQGAYGAGVRGAGGGGPPGSASARGSSRSTAHTHLGDGVDRRNVSPVRGGARRAHPQFTTASSRTRSPSPFHEGSDAPRGGTRSPSAAAPPPPRGYSRGGANARTHTHPDDHIDWQHSPRRSDGTHGYDDDAVYPFTPPRGHVRSGGSEAREGERERRSRRRNDSDAGAATDVAVARGAARTRPLADGRGEMRERGGYGYGHADADADDVGYGYTNRNDGGSRGRRAGPAVSDHRDRRREGGYVSASPSRSVGGAYRGEGNEDEDMMAYDRTAPQGGNGYREDYRLPPCSGGHATAAHAHSPPPPPSARRDVSHHTSRGEEAPTPSRSQPHARFSGVDDHDPAAPTPASGPLVAHNTMSSMPDGTDDREREHGPANHHHQPPDNNASANDWGFDAGPLQPALEGLAPPGHLESGRTPKRVILEYKKDRRGGGDGSGGAAGRVAGRAPTKVILEYSKASDDAEAPVSGRRKRVSRARRGGMEDTYSSIDAAAAPAPSWTALAPAPASPGQEIATQYSDPHPQTPVSAVSAGVQCPSQPAMFAEAGLTAAESTQPPAAQAQAPPPSVFPSVKSPRSSHQSTPTALPAPQEPMLYTKSASPPPTAAARGRPPTQQPSVFPSVKSRSPSPSLASRPAAVALPRGNQARATSPAAAGFPSTKSPTRTTSPRAAPAGTGGYVKSPPRAAAATSPSRVSTYAKAPPSPRSGAGGSLRAPGDGVPYAKAPPSPRGGAVASAARPYPHPHLAGGVPASSRPPPGGGAGVSQYAKAPPSPRGGGASIPAASRMSAASPAVTGSKAAPGGPPPPGATSVASRPQQHPVPRSHASPSLQSPPGARAPAGPAGVVSGRKSPPRAPGVASSRVQQQHPPLRTPSPPQASVKSPVRRGGGARALGAYRGY